MIILRSEYSEFKQKHIAQLSNYVFLNVRQKYMFYLFRIFFYKMGVSFLLIGLVLYPPPPPSLCVIKTWMVLSWHCFSTTNSRRSFFLELYSLPELFLFSLIFSYYQETTLPTFTRAREDGSRSTRRGRPWRQRRRRATSPPSGRTWDSTSPS